MKIKRCGAVVVEKDIYGSRDIFLEDDIVSIQYGDKNNPQSVVGRIMEMPCDSEFHDIAFCIIRLDVSTKYHRQTTNIRGSDIISITKVTTKVDFITKNPD